MATSIIDPKKLKERYLLLFKESDESYSKIKVDNFLDKTTGLAFPPSPDKPDGVPGLMVPVPGDGLLYDQATGQLSFELGTDGLRFVGFISVDDQEPDPGLEYGDFYIVNQPDITIQSADWPGIDDTADVVYSLNVNDGGGGYRSDTGVVDGVGTTYIPDGGTSALFQIVLTAGHVDSVTCTFAGTGYNTGDILPFLPNSSGGGAGAGGSARVTAINADGGVVGVEVAAAGTGYTCDPNTAGKVSTVPAEGGSGTGITADLIIDESGIVISCNVITQGYGYKDGEEVSFLGSKTGNNATAFVQITGGGAINVNLGDRIFWTKQDKFVLIPDVTGATAILSLKPSETENEVYNFTEAPDSQNLELSIQEAQQKDDGSYTPGLISAEDKEKLDNIAPEGRQGTVIAIDPVPEDNYLDTDDPDGISPLTFNEINLLNETGDIIYHPSTIRYEAAIADSQKIHYGSDSSVLRPRVRGVVFTAEDFEIEQEIDGSTIGGNSGNYVMSLEDHVRYMTQKNFTTLPKYESTTYELGDIEITGDDTVTQDDDIILTVTLTNSGTPVNLLTYEFEVTDPSFVVETVAPNTPEANNIFLKAKPGTAGLTFIVNATVSNGGETKSVAKTISVVGAPSTIGTIRQTPDDNPVIKKVGEEFSLSFTPAGTVEDATYGYEIDLDESYYTMSSNGSTVTITFNEHTTTADPALNESTPSAILTTKVYSDYATDADQTDDNGNFASTTTEIIAVATISDVEVTNPSGTTLTEETPETFTIVYQSGAPEEDVVATATTQRSVDDVVGDESIWNMLDAEDTTFTELSAGSPVILEFNVNNHDINFSDYEIFAKLKEQYREVDGEQVLVENADLRVSFTDDSDQKFTVSNLSLTSDVESQLALAPEGIADVSYVKTIIFECGFDVELYGLHYQGNPRPFRKADVIDIDGLNVTVTFMKPGTNKLSGTLTYSDTTLEYESEELTIS